MVVEPVADAPKELDPGADPVGGGTHEAVAVAEQLGLPGAALSILGTPEGQEKRSAKTLGVA